MKTKLLLSILMFAAFCSLTIAQVPQGFNYQAVARLTTGDPIVNTTMPVRITIQADSLGTSIIWQELHPSVTTSSYGVINLVLGKGARQTLSTIATFADIDWSVTPKFLKTEIDYSGWKTMGVTRLWSVPYAKIAENLGGAVSKLAVTGKTLVNDEALFEVKNKNGQTVFAVYNEGVRVYVSDGAKALKGGFAVGGFGTDKAESTKYMFVGKDSVRIYLDTNPLTKKLKGGFAVGGYDVTKGIVQDYLDVNSDSVRIYIDSNPATKKLKGGFAVGGYDMTKGTNTNYMNVNTDASGIINPSQNRILWYPLKNAFQTGRVLIENKDSVGENSFASGYESKAKGVYSQAMGFKAIANGDYSTAIGKNAVANKINSFAFGDSARATNAEGYAIGRGAIASGYRSFAFGSAGIDSAGKVTDVTRAIGDYSFAIGQGSKAVGFGSIALGIADSARGYYSVAIGYKTIAINGYSFGYNAQANYSYSTAIGYRTKANGYYSTAIGAYSTTSGYYSTAMGLGTISSGRTSTSMGDNTTASGDYSTAMGYKTTGFGDYSTAMGYISTSGGTYSTAMGYNSHAEGVASTAMGYGTYAIGIRSTAMGYFSEANGDYSTSMGYKNQANGNRSTAMGELTIASGTTSIAMGYGTTSGGTYSTAMGNSTTAPSFCETAIGSYNTVYTPVSQFSWNPLDRLFVIGNGIYGANSNALTILKNGNVGIGTSTPVFPLDVGSYVSSFQSFGYFNSAGNHGTGSGTNSYSIRAVARILAAEFNAVSDARIKDIVDISETQSDLEVLKKLQIKDFRFIDKPNNGDKIKKGFIAQEVEQVFPEAVSYCKNFIPDIYRVAQNLVLDKNSRTLTISMDTLIQLNIGDKIKLYSETEVFEKPVVKVISDRKFVIGDWDKDIDRLFVYGKEVNDFRSVDYDRIFTLGISAIQELSKQNEEQQQEIETYKSENDNLKSKLQTLQDKIDKIEDLLAKALDE